MQGDIIAIVDELGEVIVEYSYDAWGNVTFSESSLQNMTKASTLCFVSPFTYRGYCYDYDIELYYLQSRYYSAEIGRFINTDDTQIAIATMGTVLGANLFAYCENNPVVNVDYLGQWATISQFIKKTNYIFIKIKLPWSDISSYFNILKYKYAIGALFAECIPEPAVSKAVGIVLGLGAIAFEIIRDIIDERVSGKSIYISISFNYKKISYKKYTYITINKYLTVGYWTTNKIAIIYNFKVKVKSS